MNDKELQLSRDLGDYFTFYNHILMWGFTYFIVSFDRCVSNDGYFSYALFRN